jgi:L-fucose isomerase-like protein
MNVEETVVAGAGAPESGKFSAGTTFGLIVGNRGFFPAELARQGREEMLRVLGSLGYNAICLTPEDSRHGACESLAEAHRCADLFKAHRDEIDGIIVTLPNFGDERAIANALRYAGLDVPVLVQATPDEPTKMLVAHRRDSFCGKMSACNSLWQFGIRYSLTRSHTVAPDSPEFAADLAQFAATCRIVKGFRNTRIGVLGARPAPFTTVRFSEKLIERTGISVEVLDLSEALGRAGRLKEADPRVRAKLESIGAYVPVNGTPSSALLKMAKFGVVLDEWMRDNELVGTSIQCWTAMEEFFGVVPCTVMSMLSNNLLPSACESDMTGLLGMYALQLASGTPSAIVDWNNNYGDDPDKAIVFHCSNLPKHFLEAPKMDFQAIIAGSVGKENACGTVVGRMKAGPLTFCRISTDDYSGRMRAYVGEGEVINDPLDTFGGYGVVRIPELQRLLHFICRNGYEHHVAVSLSLQAAAITDALGNYKGWDVYRHA